MMVPANVLPSFLNITNSGGASNTGMTDVAKSSNSQSLLYNLYGGPR